MKRRDPAAITLSLCAMILALNFAPGCESDSKTQAPPADNPLRFDPTEPYKLAEWWTNGDLLLHLKPTFGYDLFAGRDRYRTPIERGQWSQKTYATLQFEPYSILGARVERVAIDKDNKGELVLLIGDMKPFAPLDGPPEVLADHLIGAWGSSNRSLVIRSDGRYRLDHLAATTSSGGGAAVAGHDGWWEVADDMLTLRPDAVGLAPIRIKVVTVENQITLEGLQRQ